MAEKFNIRHSVEKNVPVVHLAGEITSDAEDALLDCYNSLPEEQLGHVILDFLETRYINSSGIAILIQLITRAADKKHKIEFSSLSPHFRKVMDIVGLTDFVQIHDSLADALE
ncbi:MAG: STAS domain-containing protein [bacterium]|nr:STAS domain-containing protein [bacterium]